MTSVSAGHIILTPTQPVGSGRPQRVSNTGPPNQESRALPTEPPPPPLLRGPHQLTAKRSENEAATCRVQLLKLCTTAIQPGKVGRDTTLNPPLIQILKH